MKRAISLFALVIAILCFAATPREIVLTSFTRNNQIDGRVSFPVSLRIIENDAFASTSLEVIALDGVTFIGDNAFAYIFTLKNVYISESTTFIGNNAFPKEAIIYASNGSYAQQWAESNGYQFRTCNIWSNSTSTLILSHVLLITQIYFIRPTADVYHEFRYRRIKSYTRCMRPQERPELYPINYRFP